MLSQYLKTKDFNRSGQCNQFLKKLAFIHMQIYIYIYINPGATMMHQLEVKSYGNCGANVRRAACLMWKHFGFPVMKCK